MEKNNKYTEICLKKDNIRKKALEARGSIIREEAKKKSIVICQKLFGIFDFSNIQNIALYASYKDEVETFDLISMLLKLRKSVYLPVSWMCEDEPCMTFYRIDSTSDLAKGYMGIMEPSVRTDQNRLIPDELDMAIVPVVAFDNDLNRTGYGKGFYDRFLAGISSTNHIIGLAFDNQRFDCVYANERDYPLNMIVTEEKIYR